VATAVAAAIATGMLVKPAGAQPPTPRGKAVIVVMHGVSWEEMAAAHVPPLQALLRRAAVGVMNSRSLNAPEEFAPYVTIGAGRGAVATREHEVADLHGASRWRYVLHEVEGLREANLQAHTQAHPGLLGTVLRHHGLRSGLLLIPRFRNAVALGGAIAMDETGTVSWTGDTWPGDHDQAEIIAAAVHQTDFLVIDLATMHGIAWSRTSNPVPTAPDPEGARKLAGLAPIFFDLQRVLDPRRDLLIIISPTCPPYGSPKHMSYAPIAIIGPGFAPGLLTSASTRRAGIVANVDIAPTILRYFGIYESEGRTHPTVGTGILRSAPRLRRSLALRMTYSGQVPASMSGHAITARPPKQPLRQILAISRRGVRLLDWQWRFAPVYAVGQFIAFLGVGAALTLAPAWARRSRRRLRIALLLAMSLPLALLFLGPLDPGGVVQPYIMVAALAAALTSLAVAGSAPVTALGALLTATSGIIILDSMTGAHLLGDYMVNFAAMYGSRFYGIGNETMGFVVASAAIGSAATAQQAGVSRGAAWALALWFVFVALVIGAPWWGANWGGGVTAAFAFTVVYAGVRAGRPRLRHWAAALAPAVIIAAAIIALDLVGNVRTFTHIGDSARLVSAGGLPAAATIAVRKIQGNLHIMTIVPWLGITLAVCAAAIWLVLKPPARLRAALKANPILWAGLAGGTAAAVIAVIVNDSGIVAASSVLGITACAMAYLALESPTRQGPDCAKATSGRRYGDGAGNGASP
jgi:hypothetical protein